jgi:ABC-type uncharacterized transport system fused permease/ATPase subunit
VPTPSGPTPAIRGPNHQEENSAIGLGQILRDAWAITHPYWFSEDRWAARGLLVVVIALNLGIVYIDVLLNKWNNTFCDALQDKDHEVFLRQLIRFCWLAGLFILLAVYQSYLSQMLQIRWRCWLTGSLPERVIDRGCLLSEAVRCRWGR